MNIQAIRDRVVVEVEFAAQVSASGIFIGEGEVKPEATVVAVGEGLDHGMCVKVGDRVLFDMGAGQQTIVDGHKLLVLREQDIIGVLE